MQLHTLKSETSSLALTLLISKVLICNLSYYLIQFFFVCLKLFVDNFFIIEDFHLIFFLDTQLTTLWHTSRIFTLSVLPLRFFFFDF
jgi:hypothetical protein